MVIVGSTGTGKTQTIKAIIYELSKGDRRVPFFIVDFMNEYGDVVKTVLDPMKGVFINPLELLGEPPSTVKYKIAGLLGRIFLQKKAVIQERQLRKAIQRAYESAGIMEKDEKTWHKPSPKFSCIERFLEELAEEGNKEAERVLWRLEPLFDLPIFSEETQIPLKEILEMCRDTYQ